jgi:hypothetical protein
MYPYKARYFCPTVTEFNQYRNVSANFSICPKCEILYMQAVRQADMPMHL